MRRVGIVVGIVALVASAFALRAARGDEAAPPDEVVAKEVLCATELADVCADVADATVEVRLEDPGTTLDRLRAGGKLDADAWLAPRPWTELAQLGAQAAGRPDPFANVSDTLARTPLVVIIRSDRRATLERACGGVIDWRCVVRHGGKPWTDLGGPSAWGNVRVGVDEPSRTTGGLLALAQIAATFVHRDAYDARDLDTAASTLDAVAAAVPAPGDAPALDTMLERADSSDLAFALEAGTRVAIASPRASGQLELVEVEPTVSADVVLATVAGATTPVELSKVQEALTSNGWHFPDKTGAGVPGAATLEALVSRFRHAWGR
jgi:hypothetical protein